jgi:hypothetical protein
MSREPDDAAVKLKIVAWIFPVKGRDIYVPLTVPRPIPRGGTAPPCYFQDGTVSLEIGVFVARLFMLK